MSNIEKQLTVSRGRCGVSWLTLDTVRPYRGGFCIDNLQSRLHTVRPYTRTVRPYPTCLYQDVYIAMENCQDGYIAMGNCLDVYIALGSCIYLYIAMESHHFATIWMGT